MKTHKIRHRRLDLAIVPGFLLALPFLLLTTLAGASTLEPFAASPDQVLVIYNADWPKRSEGTTAENDSREVAEYYVRMHTDPRTGKKPHLLGLSCRHSTRRHLNDWHIREDSTDNRNGIVFRGKGPSPAQPDWIRDSRKVEIHVNEPDADWDTLLITCRSAVTGEERAITRLNTLLLVSGIPSGMGDSATYPPVASGKGRSFRLDASKLFRGTVDVSFTLKNRQGKLIRDLKLRYFDARDFAFSPTGSDGVHDDENLEEDVLQPVRRFLEEPKNALPDGTPLRDHVLYIVVVHGMPFSGMGVHGIDHGATSNRGDHGALASLEQRLQTLYYDWKGLVPPVIPFYMAGGPDADRGVRNHIVTTAYRRQLGGLSAQPYMHPDTYISLRDRTKGYTSRALPSFQQQRKQANPRFFSYGVSRLEGSSPEEAKRLVDNAIYATRYLRPEIDCRVRSRLAEKSVVEIEDLSGRLRKAEQQNLWGDRELAALGFIPPSPSYDQGLPLLARPDGEESGACGDKADWKTGGFYPGGMGRTIDSSNGLNFKTASIWQYLKMGVTVSAAGAPAYSGGPHITNASFWDNAVMTRCIFRGHDLGECFLRSTWYINWSTSLIGDPLFNPDLRRTVIDRVPPRPAGEPVITFSTDFGKATARVSINLADTPDEPEVALLHVTARSEDGTETSVGSTAYSHQPLVAVSGLKTGTVYTFTLSLTDPYGNKTDLPAVKRTTDSANHPASLLKRLVPILEGKEPLIPAGAP